VLDDVAAALHAVQVKQLVPEAARAVDGVDTEALATQVPAELVQLWYQMAINGSRDLALAPTPRVGFEMALLRMLAFKPMPAGDAPGPRGGERATDPARPPATDVSRSVAVPVVDAPAPRKAPPSPFARAVEPPRFVEPPRPPTPSPFVEAASMDGSAARMIERPVVEATPASAPIASNEDWLAALQRQALGGPAGQLAAHARFVSGDADSLTLALLPEGEAMKSDISVRRLAEGLAPLYGRPPQLRFVDAPRGETSGAETLFDRQQRQKSERQQDAEARFLSDPVVKQLMAQGAKLVDGSIRPIEE
jgi:DNA polymerase-3 subunit gamma/tau